MNYGTLSRVYTRSSPFSCSNFRLPVTKRKRKRKNSSPLGPGTVTKAIMAVRQACCSAQAAHATNRRSFLCNENMQQGNLHEVQRQALRSKILGDDRVATRMPSFLYQGTKFAFS
jgi:hypothetical protein